MRWFSVVSMGNEHIALIRSLFTEVREVSISGMFLIVCCESLPSKPWSPTIGGIPLFVTNSLTETPAAGGKISRAPHALRCSNLRRLR